MYNWIGIDYGSKLAGTTAIAFVQQNKLSVIQSEKKKDADAFIISFIQENKHIDTVFIDAPLSLPSAFFNKGNNYFYRKCDVELKAMSPMFLGGLTARAIKLKDQFPKLKWEETYPKAIMNHRFPNEKHLYKKEFNPSLYHHFTNIIVKVENVDNWHAYDSLLCWYSGYKVKQKEGLYFGDKSEGLIVI